MNHLDNIIVFEYNCTSFRIVTHVFSTPRPERHAFFLPTCTYRFHRNAVAESWGKAPFRRYGCHQNTFCPHLQVVPGRYSALQIPSTLALQSLSHA